MTGSVQPTEAIARGLKLLTEHPAVAAVSLPTIDPATGRTTVEAAIRVALPNAWAAAGSSPNGVRTTEPVTFAFSASFPLRAPTLYLRRDFDRSLAHVQPGSLEDPPEPCIVDGRPSELVQQRGLFGIVDQLALWLENAALGRLIDSRQGWEPVRRDELDDIIVADAAFLRNLVTKQAGRAVFRFDYLRYQTADGKPASYGELDKEALPLNAKTSQRLFGKTDLTESHTAFRGKSIGIVVWAGKLPSGAPVITDTYQPETVVDLASLQQRATLYGCAEPLRDGLSWLQQCVAGLRATWHSPLAIILCARRPFHLIGTDSPIELCPYIIEIAVPQLFLAGEATLVRPAAHRDAIAPPLLRRLSGGKSTVTPPPWALLGAGSLGSKIALHLARAGQAPTSVIDRAYLSPHNAARHALVPTPGRLAASWMRAKAETLVEAITGLGQSAEAHIRDVVSLLADPTKRRAAIPKKVLLLVNATASLVAREAIGAVPAAALPRVIETSLFGDGAAGLLTIEGPKRNPNTSDLIAEAYAMMRTDLRLRALVLTGGTALGRQRIGEGCGSATMAISDARISMMAAPMAEAISTLLRDGLPPNTGRILIARLGDDGLGQTWQQQSLSPSIVIDVEDGHDWTVRIGARADQSIAEEAARWPQVETGGIVMGRISEAARTIHVVDVLPAPPDSRRSTGEFVLGIEGARTAVDSYTVKAGGSLYCLGTWHSHLAPQGPSSLDRGTAATVGHARIVPSILLIHTPGGYRALLASSSVKGSCTCVTISPISD